MVPLSPSLRWKAPGFRFFITSMLFLLTPSQGAPIARQASTPQMQVFSHTCTEASQWILLIFLLARLETTNRLREKEPRPRPFHHQSRCIFLDWPSTLRRCSYTTVPLDHTILRNMHIIQRMGDHYIIWDLPPEDPPAPKDEFLEDIPPSSAPIRWVRPRSSLEDVLESSVVPRYQIRNAFERYIVASLTQQSDLLSRQVAMLTQQSSQLSRLSSQVERTEQQVDQIFRHVQISNKPTNVYAVFRGLV